MSLTTKYYLITALSNAYFPLAIATLYFVDSLHFTYTQTTILFATSLFVVTVLDVLGGIYADNFGRKKSALIGYTFELIGISSFVLVDDFYVLLGFAVLMGIGWALQSGSLDALIADELGIESKEYKITNAHVQMYLFFARVAASIVGGWLYMVHAKLPFVAYALFVFFAFCVVSTVKDMHVRGGVSTRVLLYKELGKQLRSGAVVQRVVLGVLLGTLAADMLWIFYQPFYASVGFSGFELGLLFAAASLCSSLGAYMMGAFHDLCWPLRIFRFFAIASGINALIFLFGHWYLTLVGVVAMGIMSGMFSPAVRQFFSSIGTEKNRATMLSLGSSANSLGELSGFLLSGIFLDMGNRTFLLITVISIATVCLVILPKRGHV